MKVSRSVARLATLVGSLSALALVACGGGNDGHGHHAHAGHHCARGEHGGEASGGCGCRHGHGEGHGHGPHGDGHGEHGDGHGDGHAEHDHGNLPPTVASFHQVLRPIWHSEPGTGRSERACAAVEQFRTQGQAIASAPVPEGANETTWRDAVTALNASIATLAERCPSGAGAQDTLFGELHTRFHSVMEASGGGHH
ncbi:MAG: hypothetical protein IT379_17755 [Deltaproteobacteria bacterium]|nr:hypothetical protein [Deltaproteobacteria bacterium]